MIDNRFPGPDSIDIRKLKNGITLLAFENFSNPTIAFEGIVRAGSLQDPSEKSGLASFAADILMRGCGDFEYSQVYGLLETAGASLNFGAGRHITQFSGTCLVEDFDQIFSLTALALMQPKFSPEQVERLRGQIQTGLKIRSHDTRRMAALTFMETLYKGHPYSRSTLGYHETISQIKVDDLKNFHSSYYGPNGLIIAFSGAITSNGIFDMVESILGQWENPGQKPLKCVSDMARPSKTIVVHTPISNKPQSDLILGLPGPKRSAPDYLDASMMNVILGEFGMMGRIGQAVREEKGLAYYASSYLTGGLGPGPWSAEAGTAPENTSEVIDTIRQEIARIQNDPIPVEELEDCKSYRIGSLPVGLETNAALADTILDLELYDLGLDFLQNYTYLIKQVDAESIQMAAQKYLSVDHLVISVAGVESMPINSLTINNHVNEQ